MLRLVVFLGLCGLLAHAVPANSPLQDVFDNPFDRPSYGVQHTSTEAPAETPVQQGSIWGWFSQSFENIRNKIVELWYGISSDETVVDSRPTPTYEELCDPNVPWGYEARAYGNAVWVSVKIVNRFSDVAVLYARPKLEAYFNGSNDRNLTIEMTKPLRLKSPWPTGMYGPGIEEKTLVYSLYLPPELHSNPPKPLDTDLFISKEPPTKYFAIKFDSYTFAFMNFQKLENLQDLLNTQRERFLRGHFFAEVYDPPLHVSNRLNEVLVLFNPDIDKPNCAPKTPQMPPLPMPIAYPHTNSVTPEPEYRQLCKSNDYDAREYNRAVWVSTKVYTVSSDLGALTAYPKLNKYFDKNNDQGVQIALTKPVRISMAWPKSVYTPVIFQQYTYSYYIPPEYYSNIPKPLDSELYISDEAPAVMFALNFTAFTFDYYNRQKLHQLENILIRAGEIYMSSELWAVNMYYQRSQLFNRRNDILVRMDPIAKKPKCATEQAFPPCRHKGKECPGYRVLENLTPNIERRLISGNLYITRRTNTCNLERAYDEACLPLRRYLNGTNSANEIIGWTTPTILVHKSTDNPPEGCDFSYKLMFYLPADKRNNAPAPTENGVELTRIEAKEAFVIKFQGNSTSMSAADGMVDSTITDEVVNNKVTKLHTLLDSLGYCYTEHDFAIATYDYPRTERPPHRHEIWIPRVPCATPRPETQEGNPQYSVQVNGCDADTECPAYESVRSYENFKERIYGQSVWVCKSTISCNIQESFNDSITQLYGYFESRYEVAPKSRPLISFLSVPDFLDTECSKEIETCAYLPETGRLPLVPPQDDMYLVNIPSKENPWQRVYVADLQGPPTLSNIQSGIATLLRDIANADLTHMNSVFVARYTLPWEDVEPHIEVGALTDTGTKV